MKEKQKNKCNIYNNIHMHGECFECYAAASAAQLLLYGGQREEQRKKLTYILKWHNI